MGSTREGLTGRRGWTTVASLSAVLAVVVAGQVPAASAEDRPLAPVAGALRVLVPSFGPTAPEALAPVTAAPELQPAGPPVAGPATTTSADGSRPGPVAVTALPAAAALAAVAAAPVSAANAAPAAPAPAAPRPAPPVARKAPAAAPAPAPSVCSGAGWQARRGAAALASLRSGAERTGFRVEFAAARKGYMGLTHLKQRRIEVFVRACGVQSDELLRHVIAHELGHAYDTTHGTTAARTAWKAARGIPASTPWYGCSGCADFATPAGDFAEVYAQWTRGASSNRSQLAGDVPPAQLAALAQRFFGA